MGEKRICRCRSHIGNQETAARCPLYRVRVRSNLLQDLRTGDPAVSADPPEACRRFRQGRDAEARVHHVRQPPHNDASITRISTGLAPARGTDA